LSKKQDLKKDDIKLRKKKLQDEIELIEDKYSRKANMISGGIESTLKPIHNIKKHPFKSVGVSIAVGLLIGISGRRRRKSNSSVPDAEDRSGGDRSGFTSLLIGELKRMAAKRAIVYISDFVDQKVMPGITTSHSEKSQEKASSETNSKG
jgi:ElaB/YqjD/DUF883 family membrane-anchored ribosome-binding protein